MLGVGSWLPGLDRSPYLCLSLEFRMIYMTLLLLYFGPSIAVFAL